MAVSPLIRLGNTDIYLKHVQPRATTCYKKMAVTPLKASSKELEKEDVIEILTDPPMESVSVPPFRPKEGEIYLHDASSKSGKHVS